MLFIITQIIRQLKMNKIVRTTLAASIALALTACGSDSKDPAPAPEPEPTPVTPTTLEVTGKAIKGTIIGGTVNIHAADDTEFATPLGTTQTDENGSYTVTVTDETGEPILGAYVVNVVADEDTTMICDAPVCGDVVRGEAIPSADVQGLSLTTILLADDSGAAIEADINVLTTLATDAVVATANGNDAIDLATLDATTMTSLEEAASEVVGSILGIDLSNTNIYDVVIVDSSDTEAVADASSAVTDPIAASIASTLTLINSSVGGITGGNGGTVGDNINNYVEDVAVVTDVLVETAATTENPEDLGAALELALMSDAAVEALGDLDVAQTEISDQVTEISETIAVELESAGSDVVIVVEEVPTTVDTTEIIKVVEDVVIVIGTGATGG